MNFQRNVLSIAIVFSLLGCSDTPPKNTNNVNNSNNTNLNNSNNSNNANNNTIATSEKIDILMVVDNSGSMCQEQFALLDAAAAFFDELAETDFHIGVTTTHMNEAYTQEPVAVPGHLQTQIQPRPGFDRTCIQSTDENGVIIADAFEPTLRAIEIAVACMQVPDDTYLNPTTVDLECAVFGLPNGCAIDGRCAAGQCGLEDLFPPNDAYRVLPNTIRSQDYVDGESLDIDAITRDFACIAFAGARGYGFEKGLAAASLAVSPELTGGTVEDPTDALAPNHGLIRQDARFGLIFFTDENDCSHDGNIDEASACGDDECAFAEAAGTLTPIEALNSELRQNLAATKGGDLALEDIFIGSIHGDPVPFEGSRPNDCTDGGGVEPVCLTSLGSSFSGSRYDAFIKTFDENNVYPAGDGAICSGNPAPALVAIGALMSAP